MERFPRDTSILLLGAAMVLSVAVTVAFCWHTTFFADSWDLLIERRHLSLDTVLRPHNEHLVAIPILINWLFLHVFGMTSNLPEVILLALMLVATAGLLYVYIERRIGGWPALYAAVLLLFLGPAFEVLLWPFEIALVGPMLFGLGALLLLDRPSSRNDALACLCLTLGLGFSDLGVPFIAAGFVAVMLDRRDRWLPRAYVWVVPLLAFVVWYLGWGHETQSHISLHNLLASPAFVINTICVSIGALTGLGTEPDLIVDTSWGRIVAVLLACAVAYWWWLRRPRLDRTLWPILAAAMANWVLAALNAFAGREPTSSRYQYAGAIFVLGILACLLSGARPRRNWLIAGAVLVLIATGPNLVALREASKTYKREAVLTRADTAGIEIAQDSVEPLFELVPENAGTGALVNIYAGKYLEAVEEFGSPAYSLAELESAPAPGRLQADVVLFHALPITVKTAPGVYAANGPENCVAVGKEDTEEVRLDPGKTRIEIAPGDAAALAMRRFSGPGEFPVVLPAAPGESTTVLTIPRDTAPNPWYLHVAAAQAARVCR